MKSSANKIIKSLLNFKDVNNFKKKINKKTIYIGTLVFCLLIILSYFLRPMFFKYDLEKAYLEKKIDDTFKIKSKIKGKIKYNFLPSPRIVVENMDLNFNNLNKKNINFQRSTILLSTFNLKNIKNFNFQNFLVYNQKIKIYPKEIKNYLKYMALKKEKNIIFKNSDFFFINNQGDELIFTDLNLNQNFTNDKNQISLNSIFSNNKIKIKFKDKKNENKYFNASIPKLKTSLDITFNPESNLENQSGQLRLDLFKNIILVNFDSSDHFKISDSFFRNRFLNSKFDGKIYFKNNFSFNLNFIINKMNLRKLLFYYFDKGEDSRALISGLSKKVNGIVKINNKSSNSFVGKINDFNATLVFENGDLKIENASAKFSNDTKINFKMVLRDVKSDPNIDFSLNFLSNDSKKFFRKFELYNIDDKQITILANGVINLYEKRIKFRNIIKNNNEKISRNQLTNIEEQFNKNVIDKNILDIMDFFKLKKFAKEIVNTEN